MCIRDRNNLDKAKIYTDQSIQIAKEHQLKSALSKGVCILGNIAEARGQYELANIHYGEALESFKDLKHVEEKVRCYLGLARTYLELDDIVAAYDPIINARELLQNMDNNRMKLRYYIIEAFYNQKKNNPTQTLKWLQIADKNAKTMNALYQQGDVHRIYANHYQDKGDYKKAFQRIELYHSLKDSISQLQMMYAVHDLEAKYSKVEQDLKIQKLAADKGMMNMQLMRNKKIMGIGTAISVLLLLLSGMICLLYTSPSPRDATLSRMPSSA